MFTSLVEHLLSGTTGCSSVCLLSLPCSGNQPSLRGALLRFCRVLVYSLLKWKSLSCVQLFAVPWTVACQASLSMDSPGQNTGLGGCSLFQGSSQPRDGTQVSCVAGRFFTILATREAHRREQVAMPSSRGSSQPMAQTQVSRIAGRFFTDWATREPQD